MATDWDARRTSTSDLPPHVWQFIKDKGFFGMIIPKEYGGLGFSAYAHSQVITKLSTRCGTTAVTVMVPNSLGPGELLVHYGTEEQKEYYLPRLAKGLEIPCFALTNPYAGLGCGGDPRLRVSCAGASTKASACSACRVTWDKRYITLGPVATLLGLAFRVYDPDKLLGDKEDLGITCALVPTSHPGVHIGRRHMPLNCGVPERTELGPRRLHPDGLGDRRPADDRQGLADADGVPRGGPRASRCRRRTPGSASSPCARSAPTRACARSSRCRSASSKASRRRSRASAATST